MNLVKFDLCILAINQSVDIVSPMTCILTRVSFQNSKYTEVSVQYIACSKSIFSVLKKRIFSNDILYNMHVVL